MTSYHRPMGLVTDLGMRPLIARCNLGRGRLYRRTSNPQQAQEFLANTSAFGVASLLAVPRPAAAEPPPETTRVRLTQDPAICFAPQYLAEELLRLEGFSEVEYVKVETSAAFANVLTTGAADIKM